MTDDPRTPLEYGDDQEKFEAYLDHAKTKPQRLGQGRWHNPLMREPYPAQMICLGNIGDPDGRHWWWVRDADDFCVRCQDAAQADFGWFPARRLRLVGGPP
jgi:hypothetical protein